MNRHGFTLIEVIVGLTVAASVVLVARSALVTVLDHSGYVTELRIASDQSANGERWFTMLTARTITVPGKAFVGRRDHATFWSRCETADGWLAECEIQVRFQPDSSRFAVTSSTGLRFVLREQVTSGSFGYYIIGARGGAIMIESESQLQPPNALLVIADADTLVFHVGDRG